MAQSRRSRKTTDLPAYVKEPDTIGTPKDELLVALTQLRVDCAYPAPLKTLSLRVAVNISGELRTYYRPPDDPPCRLYSLSIGALSEVLAGKRKRLPKFDWIASCVLSVLCHAVGQRPSRHDQGTTVLPYWHDIYALHAADAAGDVARGAEVRMAYQLPRHQQDFVLAHGPYGEVLLARAQLGHPHARYRVALLMACDPALAAEAAALLIDVASTGHPLALDLLDACRDVPAPAGPDSQADGSLSEIAAQCAWELACAARDHGAEAHACAFFRAAARRGIREAVFELAKLVLTEVDPELAGWLAELGAEEAIGRHHASEQ